MTTLKTTVLALLALGAAGLAQAHDYALGGLAIAHPFAFATPPNGANGAAYMTITNAAAAPDRLVEVRAGFAGKAELHRTEAGADGVMKMIHQPEGIEVPAGGTAVLEPGGYHVMLLGLTAPLVEGTKVPVVLVFETAGEIEVELAIEKRGAGTGDGHGDGHGGGDGAGHGSGHGG
jgi:copper(I)-binding protein